MLKTLKTLGTALLLGLLFLVVPILAIVGFLFIEAIVISHHSEIISPDKKLKISLYNRGDGLEADYWVYDLDSTKIAECSPFGGSLKYKLIRWIDNENFVVLIEAKATQKAQEVIVNIQKPKIPCEVNLAKYSADDFEQQYIVIPMLGSKD